MRDYMLIKRAAAFVVLLGCFVGVASGETIGPINDHGGEYWLVVPDGLNVEETVHIVAVGHGLNGKGSSSAGNANRLIREGITDAVFVCPTYPSENYIFADAPSCELLIRIVEEDVRKRFAKTHPKLFMFGFSGGSQFSHRFTISHPDLVMGCAAHSGGSWSMIVDPDLMHIPFAVSCGLDDSEGGMGSRIKNAQVCFDGMAQAGMWVKARYWPGVGHSISAGAIRISVECYRLAQQGMFPEELDYVEGQPSFEEQALDLTKRSHQRKADKLAKNAAKDLPVVPRKDGPFACVDQLNC